MSVINNNFLPLFLRLGSFKLDRRAKLKKQFTKTSAIYATAYYSKKKFHKPIIF